MMLKTDPAGRFHAHKVLELPFWNLVLPSAPNSIMNAQDTGEDCEDNFAHSNSASVKGQPTKPASFSQKHDRAFVGRACNNTRLAKEFDLCKKPRLSGIRSYRSTSKGESCRVLTLKEMICAFLPTQGMRYTSYPFRMSRQIC